MKKYFLLFVILILIDKSMAQEKSIVLMPPLFGDNMVLQRETNVSFWGKANPGLQVSVKGSWGSTAKAVVAADSSWKTKLKTPKAGGPFTVKIKIGDSSIDYKNVLIGEVWICSGQSNMEMPLSGWPPADTIVNSANEIKAADLPNLRLFTVPRAFSCIPEFSCPGKWSECKPEIASSFSATAYFFGRKISQELKIPVGLIHTSWGGTAVQPWIEGKAISTLDQFKEVVSKLKESEPQIKEQRAWLLNHPSIDIAGKIPTEKWKDLDFQDSECSKPEFSDMDWKIMKLPALIETTAVGDLDGAIWFRKKINIPAKWMNKDLVLELAAIDDMDESFVNGVKVGGYETEGFWQTKRVYNVPAEIIKDSVISIAVRVIDNQGGGGIWGDPELLRISLKDSQEKISLAGDWKYLVVAQFYSNRFYVFGTKNDEYNSSPKVDLRISMSTPTALFNAMIAPLVPYTIRGAIWYQGEANVGQADLYKELFPLMIKSWRDVWQIKNFPFYYVQIAPWQYNPGSNSQKLREAQLLSLSTPNTGMAVTMDIGSPNTIHPGKKKEVGERLANIALSKNYKKKVAYSGPVFKSMKIDGEKIILKFDHVEGGLVLADKEKGNNFLIAGDDRVFMPATVLNDGNKLTIFSPDVKKPVAVRYGWSDYVDGSLFNKAGLPASSFRTDNWQD